jgi:hypothetical protein
MGRRAPAHTHQENDMHWLTIPALALTLTIQAPAGCTITGTTGPDEGFPVATCDDGTTLYADMDGNALPGMLYRAPGTWVEIPS